MSRFKGFTRVASGFDPIEIRMAVTALDGAGFKTITPGIRLSDTLPHISLAFGPVEVLVPDEEAEEAKALLGAIAAGTVIVHDQQNLTDDIDDDTPPIPRKGRLGNLFGFLIAGVSRPLKGLLVEPRKRD